MEHLPVYIAVLFIFTTILAVFIFCTSLRNPKNTLFVLLAWLALQGFVSLSGFYTITNSTPPRFVLLILPPFLFITLLFFTRKGRAYLDRLDIKRLTILHTVRILVELVLCWLYTYQAIPGLMTFAGGNYDILSGLTAPFIFFFGFIKNRLNTKVMLGWNFICLALLINIVVRAVLSAPFPFQKFAFDQPNRAILYFPFVWLPCCVVPLVLLAHLTTIRALLKQKHS